MPAVPLSRPAGGGPASVTPRCSGWSKVSDGQPVGGDHERHRRGLHRDLHVVEADLLEVGQLHSGRLDERLGGGAAVAACRGRGASEPAFTPMRMGTPRSRASAGDLLDLGLLAQVARVEPQALDAGLQGGERHLVVEVDVGHDRHRRARHDLGQALGRRLLVAGAADDVGPGGRQRVDLGQGALDVGRLGGGHRLDRDRRAAADGHAADVDLAGAARVSRADWSMLPFCRRRGRHGGPGGSVDGVVAAGWAMSR